MKSGPIGLRQARAFRRAGNWAYGRSPGQEGRTDESDGGSLLHDAWGCGWRRTNLGYLGGPTRVEGRPVAPIELY